MHSKTLTPKISGLLHNCILNCALPTLLEGIAALAAYEEDGRFTALEANPVVRSYTLLKNLFADHYGLGNLRFQQFAYLLQQYSFYELEIMFAPVLRGFVGTQCELESDIPAIADLQADGQYADLYPSDAYQLFYKYFGLRIEVYAYDSKTTNYNKESYNPPEIEGSYPFSEERPTIALYFKNEHYELKPHEKLEEETKQYLQEEQDLPPTFQLVHNAVSFSSNAAITQTVLNQMKALLRHGFQEILPTLKQANKPHASYPVFFQPIREVQRAQQNEGNLILKLGIGFFAAVGLTAVVFGAIIGMTPAGAALVCGGVLALGIAISLAFYACCTDVDLQDGFEMQEALVYS